MRIVWYGQSCFKIMAKTNNGDKITIITDPFDKSLRLTPPRCSAEIVSISHDHYDHNNVKTISGEPFIIERPGEYDVRGVFIEGINSFHDSSKGEERGISTIYAINVEGLRICHLGDIGQKELSSNQIDKIGDIDILMIPVGGIFTIDASEAVKIINQIEPSIVIPMHYKLPKIKEKLNTVDKFLEEIGEKKETLEELVIQKKDLTNQEMRVVVMKLFNS
jgi:L-ascorbate metabolism protein UlaG (beta-lactamase superfamily)